MRARSESVKLTRAAGFLAAAGPAILFGLGCNSGDTAKGVGEEIRLSGTLVEGAISEGVRMGVRAGQTGGVRAGQEEGVRASGLRRGGAAGDLLPGYSLYCVTFEETPKAGKGVADEAARFTLTLAAAQVPFGCFVLDGAGERVADLIFKVGAAEALAGGVRMDRDADLATVTVDRAAYAAVANLTGLGQVVVSTVEKSATADPNFDFTGTWEEVECRRWKGTALEECPARLIELAGARVFLHRVSARDAASGSRRYLLSLWANEGAYQGCGSTEGLTAEVASGLGVALETGGEAAGKPFGFVPEPPDAGNWEDLLGACEWSAAGAGTPACKAIADPAEQAWCYADCVGQHQAAPPDICIRQRVVDAAYFNRYLRGEEGGTFNPRATDGKAGFFTYLDEPLGRRTMTEVIYHSPLSLSGASLVEIVIPYWDSTVQATRTCIETLTSSVTEVFDLAGPTASEDNVLNVGISASSPDYAWCVQNSGQLYLSALHGTLHLRTKARRID